MSLFYVSSAISSLPPRTFVESSEPLALKVPSPIDVTCPQLVSERQLNRADSARKSWHSGRRLPYVSHGGQRPNIVG